MDNVRANEVGGIGYSADGASTSVLHHLQQAATLHQALLQAYEGRGRDLEQAHGTIEQLRAENQRLTSDVESLMAALAVRREAEARQREKANALAAALKAVHSSVFTNSRNIYDLILKACLMISGATRGLYILMRDVQDMPRIRAAVDVDGYPATPPSEYLIALCRKVLEENETFICNDPGDIEGLPPPTHAGEQFESFLVAPVVLMDNLHGIVLVADKIHGKFGDQDAELLLAVGDQAAVALENTRLQQRLQRAYLQMISILADVVEAKDAYTHGHCDMVARYAALTARQMALPLEKQRQVYYAGLLHDVGKVGVSDGILNKPGALLPEELELVRSHVRIGHDLVAKIDALTEVAKVVLHHHEWYDGSGYPSGLSGENIPIASRIICVADSYSAMITKRSYKNQYSEERAQSELRGYAGRQFDPQVVDAFLQVITSYVSEDPLEELADIGVELLRDVIEPGDSGASAALALDR